MGVYFNDNTRLLTDPSGRRGLYIEGVTTQHIAMEAYPPALQKKVTLMGVFRKALLAEEHSDQAAPETPLDDESIFLKKWVKTKQGTFFILSPVNKAEGEGVIQVNFIEDNSRVLLHHSGTQLTYVDPHGVVSTQALDDGNMPSDEKLRAKLQYINQILYHLINPSRNT